MCLLCLFLDTIKVIAISISWAGFLNRKHKDIISERLYGINIISSNSLRKATLLLQIKVSIYNNLASTLLVGAFLISEGGLKSFFICILWNDHRDLKWH